MASPSRKLTVDLETTVAAGPDQVSCELDGETAILQSKAGVYYGLDAVGTRAWQLLQRPTTVQALRDTMLAEFSVSEAQLEQDLCRLVADLAAAGLVELS